jgi:hypothetical protein
MLCCCCRWEIHLGERLTELQVHMGMSRRERKGAKMYCHFSLGSIKFILKLVPWHIWWPLKSKSSIKSHWSLRWWLIICWNVCLQIIDPRTNAWHFCVPFLVLQTIVLHSFCYSIYVVCLKFWVWSLDQCWVVLRRTLSFQICSHNETWLVSFWW